MIEKCLNEITQGDCLSLLQKLPDASVDLAFADPPFNLKKGYNRYKDSLQLEHYLALCEQWIAEMVRVTQPNGSICVHNIPRLLKVYPAFLHPPADVRH